MKYLFLTLLWVTTALAFGQNDIEAQARQATDALTAHYKLDEAQQQQMYQIQLRKYRNLQQIAAYKQTNPTLYLQKLKAIRLGTDGSIKRLLRNEQLPIYYEDLRQRRKREAQLIKELRSQGATQQQIDAALMEELARQ